jgi:hypothetical protein
MKKSYSLVIAFTVLALILSFTTFCTSGSEPEEAAVEAEEAVQEEVEPAEEAEVEEIEEEREGELNFSYTDKFPEFWGEIRIVEPALASFENIEMEIGEGILEGQEAFSVSGKLKGEQDIRYCFNPDQGIFATITGIVVDNNSNIKWSQDGFLQGTGSYIKEDEVKEFMLINSIDEKIESGDNLILIAHTEYGMIEDDETLEGSVDKGVFAEFRTEIENYIIETEDIAEENEAEYKVGVLLLTAQLSGIMEKIGNASINTSEGNMTIEEHKAISREYIDEINSIYDIYLGLKPSKRFEKSHNILGKAMDHYLNSATYLQSYIDAEDIDSMINYIEQSTNELNLGNEYLDKTIIEVESINK